MLNPNQIRDLNISMQNLEKFKVLALKNLHASNFKQAGLYFSLVSSNSNDISTILKSLEEPYEHRPSTGNVQESDSSGGSGESERPENATSGAGENAEQYVNETGDAEDVNEPEVQYKHDEDKQT